MGHPQIPNLLPCALASSVMDGCVAPPVEADDFQIPGTPTGPFPVLRIGHEIYQLLGWPLRWVERQVGARPPVISAHRFLWNAASHECDPPRQPVAFALPLALTKEYLDADHERDNFAVGVLIQDDSRHLEVVVPGELAAGVGLPKLALPLYTRVGIGCQGYSEM